jgi:hypothetical protein
MGSQDAGGKSEPDKDYTYWKREIERAEKHFSAKFWKKADTLYKLYSKQEEETDGKKKFAMLWANTEVMKPSIYARPPIPQVSRRYKDADPIGRTAAELLERASGYEFERMNIDSTLRSTRDDLLLPGRGVAWLRYEADIEADPVTGMETVTKHRAVCDYLHYRQFLHEPARRWEEVTWVAKIAYMSNEEGKARFKDSWKNVQLDNKADSSADSHSMRDPALENAQEAKATVYEIWCKKKRKTIFIAKSCDHVLAEEEPLLDFENFFPCPKPVFATLTNNSLLPTPDYKYYQDQAEEIDHLTDRIDKLMDTLKLVGFYPAGAEGDVSSAIELALSPKTQNQMIPVASWAAFSERGGGNAIVWLPIKDVAETIKSCVELRNQVIQDTYQITGISDILRGQSEASETATAQSIKAQWGSVRIRDRQQEMARLARDITSMTCEIIAEEFDGEYLLTMANMPRPEMPQMPQMPPPQPPPQPTGDQQQDQQAMMAYQQAQQQAQAMQQQVQKAMEAAQAENQKIDQALALLKDERLRGFRIDIETDSTIQPDEDAEKQRRTEFVTAIGGLFQQAIPVVQQVPEMAPLVGEILLFTARGFRAGRQLEDEIEKAMKAVQERISGQMGQQQQDPNAAINAAKAKQMEAETEHKGQLWTMERDHKAQMNELDLQQMMRKTDAEVEVTNKRARIEQAIMGQRGELEVNSGKAKLREQILQEEQEAFLGQPGEQVNGVAQVLQEAMAGLMQAVQQSNQQVLTALSAPKIITTPDGRQYTAQTAVN